MEQVKDTPLAVRMRPKTLDDFVGQEHILGPNKLLRRALSSRRVSSLILWGPPGCGKTTLGTIVASHLAADFVYLNAAFTNVASVKKALDAARKRLAKEKHKTLIFIDEIHRFSKLQQEVLVPDSEEGNIILVGATIHTPYYYLIPSLISRSIVAPFKPLVKENIVLLIKRAISLPHALGNLKIEITDKALDFFISHSLGDARRALTALEIAALSTPRRQNDGKLIVNLEAAKNSTSSNTFYDKKDEAHYDTISAFIKSIRGSDPDSAVCWLAKMLAGGEDPRFIARRLTILASEDIGNANPFALVFAAATFSAVEFVGLPEAEIILAQAVTYLASSPKSNASYMALSQAKEDLGAGRIKDVPEHLKTHSKNYKYPHSFGGYVKADYGALRKYYFPTSNGQEAEIKDFLENLGKEQ